MLTAVVLCRNEADNLPRCLASAQFCDRILVIDDQSTDNSAKIAATAGAKVYRHNLNGDFSAQRNYALAQISTGWVLFVDADEEVSPELAQEVKTIVDKPGFSAFYLPRTDFLWGRQLKYGDLKDFHLIRLAKKDSGLWQGKIHETWQVHGNIGTLSHPLYHYPHRTLYKFLHTLNFYSSVRAAELSHQKISVAFPQVVIYPLGKFFYLYFWRLGLLDGTAGFIHAICMSFYTFLVRGKLFLIKQGIGEYV